MNLIPLTPVSSQQLSFNVDNAFWTIRIFQAINSICADVTLNGVAIMTGIPCFAGRGIMPYSYMQNPNYGNFVFDSVPDWTVFGTACNLWYLEASEYKEFQEMILLGTSNIPSK